MKHGHKCRKCEYVFVHDTDARTMEEGEYAKSHECQKCGHDERLRVFPSLATEMLYYKHHDFLKKEQFIKLVSVHGVFKASLIALFDLKLKVPQDVIESLALAEDLGIIERVIEETTNNLKRHQAEIEREYELAWDAAMKQSPITWATRT